MIGNLLLAFFAAFGMVSALWSVFGWLLPNCREGWLVCPGRQGKLDLVQVYLWLRSLGVLKCPLILVDLGLSQEDCRILGNKGIEIYSPAELLPRLGIGAEET